MFSTRAPGLYMLRHQHAVHVQHAEMEGMGRPCEAAAAVPPRAAEDGQARQRAKLHRAVAMVLDADERPQQRRLRGRVFAGEALDLLGRQSDRVRYLCRRVLLHALRQGFVPDGVLRHVVVIHEAVANHDVHHRQRQRRIARGLDLDVPVGGFRGAGPDRIDDHDLRPAALGFEHQRPEVEIGDDRVRPPQHDEPAVDHLFRVDARAATNRGRHPRGRHRPADVAIEAAAAHRPEQAAVERRLLDDALHAGGAVRKNGLRARLRGDRLPPRRDVGERLVPAHAHEPALALAPRPLQRDGGRDRDGRPARGSGSPWRRACRG